MSFRSCYNLLALKWHDERDVWMLTTCHSTDIGHTTKIDYRIGLPLQKPTCVIDHNVNKGGVDKIDMVLNSVQSIRKSLKWYDKYFFLTLNIVGWNAYCLFQSATATKQKSNMRCLIARYSNNPKRVIESRFPCIYLNEASKKKSSSKMCHLQ